MVDNVNEMYIRPASTIYTGFEYGPLKHFAQNLCKWPPSVHWPMHPVTHTCHTYTTRIGMALGVAVAVVRRHGRRLGTPLQKMLPPPPSCAAPDWIQRHHVARSLGEGGGAAGGQGTGCGDGIAAPARKRSRLAPGSGRQLRVADVDLPRSHLPRPVHRPWA